MTNGRAADGTSADGAGDALLSTRQLAERLDVSTRTVQRRLDAAGAEPATTRQGVRLYAAEVLERIAEPPGAAEEHALATTATATVAAALEVVRAGYEAALAAERSRADAAAAERDRASAAAAEERERLAAATGATIAELRRRAETVEAELAAVRGRVEAAEATAAEARERQAAPPPAPPARGFWARLTGA